MSSSSFLHHDPQNDIFYILCSASRFQPVKHGIPLRNRSFCLRVWHDCAWMCDRYCLVAMKLTLLSSSSVTAVPFSPWWSKLYMDLLHLVGVFYFDSISKKKKDWIINRNVYLLTEMRKLFLWELFLTFLYFNKSQTPKSILVLLVLGGVLWFYDCICNKDSPQKSVSAVHLIYLLNFWWFLWG